MVQNAKSKKAKQTEKIPPVNNDSEQSHTVKNAPPQNHTENESEMNSVPKVESKTNGELNNVAESEGPNAPRLAVKSRTKKAAESAAETKTTVSERGDEKSALPQSKSKGRLKKEKNMEIDTVETKDEQCNSENAKTEENELDERPPTPRKRKAASPTGAGEIVESESSEASAPAKKTRAELTQDKAETEQESTETAAPTKRSRRGAATAKGKAKETVEQADEIEQESVEAPEPAKKSRKRKAAEPVKAVETKSKKRDVKTAAPATKSKKQKVLLRVPSVRSISGKVFVMGQNDVGQLGFGEEVEGKLRPAMLELPHSITTIAAGGMHSVCLTESGEVITFGCNDEGALGRVTTDGAEEASPGRVEIPEKVVQISAGDSHTAALTESGQVYIWGNFRSGDGPMGLTTDGVKQIKPVKILNKITIVKISSGADHLACLSNDGIVYTCGCGQNGQLGRLTERACPDGGRKGLATLLEPAAVPVKGHLNSRTRPVLIEDVWTSNYSTFLKAQETGQVFAFGLNNYNQLGYENERVSYVPKQIPSFNAQTWKEIAGGQHHTLSLDSDGLVYSIGRHDYGRLGLGENCGEKSVPTLITSLEKETCTNISCGNDVSFAVTKDGSLYSWGMGDNQQLGHGNEEDCHTPRRVEGNFAKSWKALEVSGGGQHTLVLATSKESDKK